MLRSALLAGSVVVLCVLGAGNASAKPPATTVSAKCAGGAKLGRVGGVYTCLKVGQPCSAKHQGDYGRVGFLCRGGRLHAKVVVVKPAPPAVGSTRADPIPFGKPGVLPTGWTLTVTALNPDATSAILAADPANKPPLDGYQYVLVSVSASFDGAGSSHLSPASTLHAIGPSGFAHSTANSYCGTLPSPSLDALNPLVFKGGTIAGYATCWMVAKADVAGLEMYWQPLLGGTQVWFALH
jgi:hypothetical protein